MPVFLERQLVVIEELNKQIKEADAELVALTKDHPVCRRLMTVPGVGPLTAVEFHAVVADNTRFPHAHAIESYLGLTPGERSSSTRKRRTGITKAGSPEMRRLLNQACWCIWRQRPLVDRGIDTIVLGCTHYPLLRPLVQEIVGTAVRVIDSATAVAKAVASMLTSHDLVTTTRTGPDRFFATDVSTRVERVGGAFLGASLDSVTLVDL